jgi:cell filamentation protein
MNEQQRQNIEAQKTKQRIAELRLSPVVGAFDVAHLKEINRRIFQDLPGLGFSEVTPGIFRPPAIFKGRDWIKSRRLESVNATTCIAYSRMDTSAQKRLEQILERADPVVLGKLKTAEFTKTLGSLYVELDYIHPFKDGNSRTLREFTRQLAKESGYDIDWERFNCSPAGRDVLYIARDISVNRLALSHIKDVGTKRDVLYTLDSFGQNKDLPKLLRDAIRLNRAVAFEKMPEAQAIKRHPDLAEAFKTIHTAEQYFKKKIPGDVEQQKSAVLIVRKHVQEKLDHGETKDFRTQPRISKTIKATPSKKHDDPEIER